MKHRNLNSLYEALIPEIITKVSKRWDIARGIDNKIPVTSLRKFYLDELCKEYNQNQNKKLLDALCYLIFTFTPRVSINQVLENIKEELRDDIKNKIIASSL